MSLKETAEAIRAGERFLLVGHVKPDGDSISCQLALAEALDQLGREAVIRSRDQVPRIYRRLPGVERIEVVERIDGAYDTALLLEITSIPRTGFTIIPATRIVGIDHHPHNELKAQPNWVDTSAAAAAEMVYQLLGELGVTITQSIAENLLTGIMTDSGSYTYPNTTPKTLEIAAALMRAGADPTYIAEISYRSYPTRRLQLIADVIGGMELLCDGQLALLSMSHKEMDDNGYTDEMFENIVNMPLTAEMVLVSALGREDANGEWRFSLRSKGSLDVGAIAATFGGGGHRNAAGFRSRERLQKIREHLVEAADRVGGGLTSMG